MQDEIKTFEIPEHRMPLFAEKIAALNKKAVKVGVPEITYSTIGHFDREYTEHPVTGQMLVFPMVIRFFKVVIVGIEPKFAGWTFLARIDHEGEGVNIINAIPGVELNERYRTMGGVCEHCKIDRYRKASFVVRHESGEEKQVGSSCLKDFLGHGSPEKIASFCESLFSFIREVKEDDFYYGGHIEHRHEIIKILALTSAVIRKYGWTSAAKAYDFGTSCTADTIREYVSDAKQAAEISREIGGITEADVTLAKNAIDWLKGKEGPFTDYFHNLRTVCANETIEVKRIGLVASLIAVYNREMEGERLKTVKEPSAWIGHPDTGRMTLKDVKVIGMTPVDGRFGTTYIYRFLANGKDKLTWFSTNCVNLDNDSLVNITFGVKKLDTYKGEHITVITRVKATKA